jgi:hypothetical protein
LVTYWDNQTKFDVAAAAIAVFVVWFGPRIGLPTLFHVGDVRSIAQAWLSPILSFLGMTSATTAFIFTVIDRPEFNILRGKHAESQLWRIFAQTISWLSISAIFCVLLTFVSMQDGRALLLIGTFLVVMLFICVGKFAWVMRQVISVRINQTADLDA